MESSEDDEKLVESPDDPQMTIYSQHHFGEANSSSDASSITIIEACPCTVYNQKEKQVFTNLWKKLD